MRRKIPVLRKADQKSGRDEKKDLLLPAGM
jgi:hypothetical protein